MGEAWKKARDARVAEAKKRLSTPYAGYEWQQRMINDVKAPAMEAFVLLLSPEAGVTGKLGALLKLRRALKGFEQFPEPTKENTWNPNSHRLIELRDEFFQHCHLGGGRNRFLRLGINFLIIIYDYDPPYRMMIDWWAKKLGLQNWEHGIPVKLVQTNWPWWKEEI